MGTRLTGQMSIDPNSGGELQDDSGSVRPGIMWNPPISAFRAVLNEDNTKCGSKHMKNMAPNSMYGRSR
jgi:hypothetical protein